MQPSPNNPWYFTRKERIGIFVLVGVILILWLWPTVHSMWYKPKPVLIPQPALDSALQALAIPEDDDHNKKYEYKNYYKKHDWSNNNYNTYPSNNSTVDRTLFNFDPNTASAENLKQLGLRDKTIQIIINYRSKGGRFKTAEDLQKIYGLSANDFDALKPYIQIASTSKVDTASRSANNYSKKSYAYTKTPIVIDINKADSTMLERLPGIGSKLSSRIVSYRKKLGGFYSINQVAETWGLADSVFQRIKPQLNLSNPSLQKININTANEIELDAHPYITRSQAKIIVAYRNEHGAFSSIELLKKLPFAIGDWFNKISPYLAAN